METENHPCDNCKGHEESECCGALIVNHDICSDCKEHTDNKCMNCDLSVIQNEGINRM